MKSHCAGPLAALVGVLLIIALGCGAEGTDIAPATEAPPSVPSTSRDEATPVAPTPSAVTRAEMLESLTAKVILPGYMDAADSMAGLSRSVGALCSSPSEAALGAAREAWRGARRAWLRTESYRFGPAMDRRSISLVDWWPIEADKIERNLASEETITAERVTEFLSATQRGLSAAEYLMFGAGSDGLSDGSDSRRCAYLQSVARVNSAEVSGILEDWQGSGAGFQPGSGYAAYFDGTGSLALIDSDAEAEVVRSLVFQVRAIANMRLGAGLGIDTEADASAIPTGGADNSREDLLSQLEGIAAIYRGAEDGLGLSARVAAPGLSNTGAETDARMLSAIESTISAVRDLDGSVVGQLESNPPQVRAVYDSMKELQRVLNTEIVSLLGVSVGFSDTDGDS